MAQHFIETTDTPAAAGRPGLSVIIGPLPRPAGYEEIVLHFTMQGTRWHDAGPCARLTNNNHQSTCIYHYRPSWPRTALDHHSDRRYCKARPKVYTGRTWSNAAPLPDELAFTSQYSTTTTTICETNWSAQDWTRLPSCWISSSDNCCPVADPICNDSVQQAWPIPLYQWAWWPV